MPHSLKLCHECGTPISGRSDKKFCDDHCRSNFNNRINSDATTEIRNINNILRRNRRVIQNLLKDGDRIRVPKAMLHDAGFNFKYHTHTHTTQRGHLFHVCYDCGYSAGENEHCTLIRYHQP